MDRRDVIQMLYDKPRIAGFQFDKLWHPPMSYYITQQDVLEIYNISRSAKLNALPLKKYGMVDEILKRRGFTRLHAGTNRLVYKSEYDSSICLKIGIDIVGREANVGEYHTQELLKPFCTKVFEVTPCGTVAMVERVNPIKNRFQFEDVGDIIFNIIIMQFAGIVLEDVGTNFFMNWGIREGFGPVVLDFPYAYEADITKLHCIQKDKLGVQCDGLIDYDDGLNNIICNKCGTRYTARELRKYYSSRHKTKETKSQNEKGEIRMAFKTQVRILDKTTGEYKVYGNPFESNKGFKNINGRRVYPTPPKPFESQGFVSKVVRPQKTTMAEALEEAFEKKDAQDETYTLELVDISEEKIDDDYKMKVYTCPKGPENFIFHNDIDIHRSDIDGEVEVNPDQENLIDTEISEIETQTPLTTHTSNLHDEEDYIEESDEDDVDYELNITDKQKEAVDRAYEEIIDEALRQVNDPDMLTNKEVNKCVRICCAHIIRNCKNINKKDIKEYIRYRIINDTSSERNIDNF